MEKPTSIEEEHHPSQSPKTLSPSSSGRRSNASTSPEFEFWMIRNPSFPQSHQLSADELFVDGVLLPLDLLPLPSSDPDPPPTPDPDPPPPEPGPGPQSTAAAPLSTSKRWRDIFKIPNNNKPTNNEDREMGRERERDKEKKKQRKGGSGAGVGTELNINIWPFSRSHSAGTGGSTRPRLGSTRKVSSAPCSRSNSAGESKSRKWPSSPGRAAGIHVGRSSPVWQVRPRGSRAEPVVRGGERVVAVKRESSVESRERESLTSLTGKSEVSAAARGGSGGGKSKVLKSLNVPTCIGYRQQLSCRREEETLLGGDGGGGGRGGAGGGGGSSGGGGGGGGGKLFNLRTLFSKKVY